MNSRHLSSFFWRALFPLVALATLFPRVVAAKENADWLRWSPPPECPPASHIVERVSGWLGGSLPDARNLLVDTELAWDGQRWEVSVRVTFEGHFGVRRVAVKDCVEAAEFVAVAVVLAVDPSLAQSLPPQEQQPFDPPATHSASEGPSVTQEPVPPQDEKVDETGAEETPRLVGERASAPGALRLRPQVTVAAAGIWGALPGPRLGPLVAGGMHVGRWALSLGLMWFPPAARDVSAANTSVDFSLLGGRFDLAYLFGGERLRVGPLLAFEGGAIRASQAGRPEGPVNEPWLSFAVGVSAEVALASAVSFLAGVELDLPLTWPTFVLSDETRIYRVSIGAEAQLGLRIFFGQR